MRIYYNSPKHSEKSASEDGEGWLLWLNAEGGSLIREEGLSPVGCLSLIGKCKAQGRRAGCLTRLFVILAFIKSQKGWRGERKGHRSAQPILPQENWGLPCSLNRIHVEKFNYYSKKGSKHTKLTPYNQLKQHQEKR